MILPVAIALLATGAGDDAGVPFLAMLPLDSHLDAGTALSSARLTLRAPEQPPLFLLRANVTSDGGTVSMRLDLAPEVTDAPVPRHTESTWLVDYGEKVFTPILESLRKQLGTTPSVDAVTVFADAFITRKSMRRGFDLASQVARSHEGDCTEHAVFLAALLRASKLPARVMMGVVLMTVEGRPYALGHAWVEVFTNGRWRIADAAVPARMGPIYLPEMEITEEGPGYAVKLAPLLQGIALQQLTLLPR
jgi:hypothetical protein